MENAIVNVVDKLNDKTVGRFENVYDASKFMDENRHKYGRMLIMTFTRKDETMTKMQKLRTERGLSQNDLSKVTGISVRSIQSYEQGARDINKMQVETALKIAQALGTKIENLLD